MENLLLQLLLDEFVPLFLGDYVLFDKTVDNHGLLLSLGGLDIQQCMNFIDQIVH
jgi:hypothetical protein